MKDFTTIGKFAFYQCTTLGSVEFSEEEVTLDTNVFDGCTSITSVYVGGVSDLDVSTFANCTSLSSVSFSSNSKLTRISAWAFKNCTALTSITLPEGVERIYSYAFQDSGITSIVLPSTVQRVGRNCFNTCTSVEFTGESLNHVWQIQDNNDNVVEQGVDITNATVNATKMKYEWTPSGETESFGYYYIRDDYEAYVQPE